MNATEVLNLLPADIRNAALAQAAEAAAEAAAHKSADADLRTATTERATYARHYGEKAVAYVEHLTAAAELQAAMNEAVYRDGLARDRQARSTAALGGNAVDLPPTLPFVGLDQLTPDSPFLAQLEATLTSARSK